MQQPAIVEKLLKKMDSSPGFASLGGAVQTISNLVDNDGDNRDIVAAILRDPALTAKLLNIANSSRYARGAGNVSTINQVLAILGLNTVKSVALSLALLNSLSSKPQSNQLYAEIVAGFFSGCLAAGITREFGANYSVQEAQVCGLMQNLGRMMSAFYLYEDIEHSRNLKIEKNLAENEAVLQTLGVSFEEIGAAIAHHWGLPASLQGSLAPDTVQLPPVQAAANAMAWNHLCSLFCRRVTEVLFRLPESREKIEIPRCIDFFQKALRLNGKDTLELIEKSLLETDAILAEMVFPSNVEDARNLLRKASERSTDMLPGQDSLVKENKSGGQTPIELVKQLMRYIHAHCNFDCTLICLPAGSGLTAIAGVGRNAGQLTTKFRSGGVTKDIFQLVMERKADTFVPDVASPTYASLIPSWYNEAVGAKSFVMLPLVSEGKLIGMIYGDYPKPHSSPPAELRDIQMTEWRTNLIQILKSGPKG